MLNLYSKDGMCFFPVYSADGTMTGDMECVEILERYEKRTVDHSNAKWFPNIRVEQRCRLQKMRFKDDPRRMSPFGDPFESWITLEDESVALPFKG